MTRKNVIAMYNRELALAKRRAKLLPSNYKFIEPEMPKTTKAILNRINDLKNVSVTRIRKNEPSKLIHRVVQPAVKIGPFIKQPEITVSLTDWQKVQKETEKTNAMRVKHGLAPMPVHIDTSLPISDVLKAIKKHGSAKYIEKRKSIFVENFINSYESGFYVFEHTTSSTEDDLTYAKEIIDKFKGLSKSQQFKILYDLSTQYPEIIPELYGSDDMIFNQFNLNTLAEKVGVKKQTVSV